MLTQLRSYITRLALTDRGLRLTSAGHVEFKHKTSRREETAHLVMRPLDFMQRRATPMPRLQPT